MKKKHGGMGVAAYLNAHVSRAALLLGATLAISGADKTKAQTVCVDGGTTITCTGSGTILPYSNRNVVLTLDGTATPMTVPSVSLGTSSGTDTNPMSIVTAGRVTLSNANTGYIISALRNGGGNGDASILISGETQVERTVLPSGGFSFPALVNLVNNTTGNSRIEIAAGARFTDIVPWGAAINLSQAAAGNVTIINRGDISAIAGTSGYFGINAAVYGDNTSASQSVYIENSGSIIVNKAAGAAYAGGYGIYVSRSNNTYPDTVTIDHSGLIQGPVSSDNDSFYGIAIGGWNSGNTLHIISSGDIRGVTTGIDLQGAQNTFFKVEQTAGEISASRNGIWVHTDGSFDGNGLPLSEATITTGGRIVTEPAVDAKGIYVGGANYSGGILALGLAQINQVVGGEIVNRGTGDHTAAIYIEQTQQVEIGVSGKVRSNEGAAIFAKEADRTYSGQGQYGDAPYIMVGGNSNFTFDVRSGGDVEGGGKLSGMGILTLGGDSSKITVHQGGSLGALSDVAVKASGYFTPEYYGYDYSTGVYVPVTIPPAWIEAAPTEIRNAGTITGVFKLGNVQNSIVNEATGVWNIRSFADSMGDGNRNYFSVAVTDLGTGGNNTVTNDGVIRLLGHDRDPKILDTTGMYLPEGNQNNAMSIANRVQGQILGAKTFINNGVIDMTGNADAGDVLVISGGHIAGVNGGGSFITGGSILMNTVLNEGGANSRSDVLVVDNVQMGTGPSRLVLSTTGNGAQTIGNGILLVEVLGSQSPSGAFVLGNRVAAGAYEYTLHQGGTNGNGNWYLTSDYSPTPPTPPTPTPPTPPTPTPTPTPDYRVEVPMAVAIPPIATEYGYSMLGTLHERGGGMVRNAAMPQPLCEERIVRGRDGKSRSVCSAPQPWQAREKENWFPGAWARLIGDRGFSDTNNFRKHGPDYDYTFGGIQAGLDVYARETADGTLDKAGAYVGYGQIDANVKGAYGGKAGSINSDAFTLGAYWTHYAGKGWYTDAVVQGTWYSTDAKSTAGQALKPDGFGVIASLEGGYTFNLGNGLVVEPQAQLAYQNTSFGDVSDAYGTFRLQNVDSLRGRLGVRIAKTWDIANQSAQSRQVTAWARANVWHEFMGDGNTTVDYFGINAVTIPSSLGGTWMEVGAGIQGQISDSTSLFTSGAYNHSLDGKGRESWNGRLGVVVKW